MKKQTYFNGDRQQGAATLAATVILLLLVGLITLYLANTSRKEQQISADQYRTEQALDAALAGLDWALDNYNTNGLDALPLPDSDGFVDYTKTSQKSLIIASGDLIVTTSVFYCDIRESLFWTAPELCPDIDNSFLTQDDYAKYIGIVSVGLSDDRTARRVVTQAATDLSPFPDDSEPKGPLTTHGSVDFNGTPSIINRYYRDNIWSGGSVTLGSATVSTFVADSSIDLGADKFLSTYRDTMTNPETTATKGGQAIEGTTSGRLINADVIENDPILSQLDNSYHDYVRPPNGPGSDGDPGCVDGNPNNYFFCAFLAVPSKDFLETLALAGNQAFTDCSELTNDVVGMVYLEPTSGECKINHDLGTAKEPVFIFIDGDLTIGGGDIYGFIYVTRDLVIDGNFVIYGSMMAEGDFAFRAGVGKFIYDPFAVNPSGGFINMMGPVEGTFRDFATTN